VLEDVALNIIAEPSRGFAVLAAAPRIDPWPDGDMSNIASLRIALGLIGAVGVLGGCAQSSARPVAMPAVPVVPANTPAQGCETVQEGKASWYGAAHQGEKTASGERFDANARTAAHPTLPLGTPIEVTNLENGRKTTLIVNDRGPRAKGRVLDVSKKGAQDLGFVSDGTAPVRIESATADCAGQATKQIQASTAGE
jgi:rare lipoprotein A